MLGIRSRAVFSAIVKRSHWYQTNNAASQSSRSLRQSLTPKIDLSHHQSTLTLPLLSQAHGKCNKILPRILNTTCKHFHTSPKRDIPPVVWFLVKPFLKLTTILSGRSFRKWWATQTVLEKKYYRKQYGLYLLAALAALGVAGVINYITHLEETPITKRRRYNAFTHDQFAEITRFEYQKLMEQYKDNIVPINHPIYQLVAKVIQRLADANQDIEFVKHQTWTIVVVNSKDANALVLPSGHIFVNTGLMEITTNEDQLATVIGHEMAHAILGHGAEHLGVAQLVDMAVIVAMAWIWAFMASDGIALVTQWFFNKCTDLLLHLPYSRKTESEADEVGLMLMAKACYDVRESSLFWNIMRLKQTVDTNGDGDVPEFLSTHPSHESRASELDALIPEAIEQRSQCNCPRLPSKDPRQAVKLLQKMANEVLAQRGKQEQLEEEERKEKDGLVIKPHVIQTPQGTAAVSTGG